MNDGIKSTLQRILRRLVEDRQKTSFGMRNFVYSDLAFRETIGIIDQKQLFYGFVIDYMRILCYNISEKMK